MTIVRYTLTADRRGRRDQDNSAEQQTADFINRIIFNRVAEFVGKYFRQGMRVFVLSRVQAGNYANKEGQKVHTTEIILDDQEFTNSKGVASEMGGHTQAAPLQRPAPTSAIDDEFMNIPGGVEDEGLSSS